MKNSILFSLAMIASAPSVAHAGPASDAVRYFYDPVWFVADPAIRNRFAEPVKTVLEQNDRLVGSGGELGCIDFSPAIDAQDYDEDELRGSLKLTEKVAGVAATVTARFSLFPGDEESRREIVWSLVQRAGSWKVADIQSVTTDWRLSEFDCQP